MPGRPANDGRPDAVGRGRGLEGGHQVDHQDPVVDALARAHRTEWARVIASTVRVTRDLDLAEECTQDAFARALEATMAARITRAKKKIATARIPYRVPSREELPERLGPVLEVIHLVFTTGHAAPSGADLVRQDLVDGALRIGRMLHDLLPREGRVSGLLALMLLVDARRETRVAPGGGLALLADQDRARWDRPQIDEGAALVAEALSGGRPDRYTVEAAIAAVHAESPTWEATDWTEIVALYDVLHRLWPSPVVELNRAAAVGLRDGPQAGLDALAPLLADPTVATYPYLSAARADFLRRLGASAEAATAYEEAAALTDNVVERAFLLGRLEQVRTRPSEG